MSRIIMRWLTLTRGTQDQIIDILSCIFARAKLFFFILRLNKCLHVLYVFVWGHGGVSHLRMSLLWPWHLTIMSGKFYHTKCHILSVHVYELGQMECRVWHHGHCYLDLWSWGREFYHTTIPWYNMFHLEVQWFLYTCMFMYLDMKEYLVLELRSPWLWHLH